ncbi:MAG: 2-oxo acid dehydrogenase subunit E2 [Deltaproteobacteria bacterium]|nr:2-oxo acid dehydrogenase subunit E2 [Deltaproteobacteria bacterium]
MRLVRTNAIRRVLMSWFSGGTPYVSASGVLDFSASQAYLRRLEADHGVKVSVQALLAAALGRVHVEFPQANRRILGGRVFQPPSVGLAMPVNLLGHAGGGRMELSMMVMEAVDRKSLRQINDELRGAVKDERRGQPKNPVLRHVTSLAERLPQPIVHHGFQALSLVLDNPSLAALSWRLAPAAVGLTNPGAAITPGSGVLFRAAAVQLPVRPIHVASMFGVSTVQDEVFAIDGQPEVRPALPLVYIFDHRLIDGVLAGRVLVRLGELLQRPEEHFGADGLTVLPASQD